MDHALLLVDDEENILRSLTRLLRRDGYTIHTASSGPQGLELLKQHAVGVIVSDQRMPEMSGVEFLSKAREIQPDTVRIVLSGYADIGSITDAINRGAIYKYITKPWDDEQLRDIIRSAFGQYANIADSVRMTHDLLSANTELEAINRQLRENQADLDWQPDNRGANHELAARVLEALPAGIMVVDESGRVRLCNRAMLRLLGPGNDGGETAAPAMPQDWLEFITHPGGLPASNAMRVNGERVRLMVAPLVQAGDDAWPRVVMAWKE